MARLHSYRRGRYGVLMPPKTTRQMFRCASIAAGADVPTDSCPAVRARLFNALPNLHPSSRAQWRFLRVPSRQTPWLVEILGRPRFRRATRPTNFSFSCGVFSGRCFAAQMEHIRYRRRFVSRTPARGFCDRHKRLSSRASFHERHPPATIECTSLWMTFKGR